MCGILGHVGSQDSVFLCLEGLKRLEYRGYDSAGIAGLGQGNLTIYKEVGKVNVLEKALTVDQVKLDCAIGHTRWATHGTVTRENAHPLTDQPGSLALVHNGIIENYALLRASLQKKGYTFRSETDTEVVANLISYHYLETNDFLKAVQKTTPLLQGSFSIACIHKDYPDQIIAFAKEAPLVIGISKDKDDIFLASDPHAFQEDALDLLFLKNDQVAVLKKGGVDLFDATHQKISLHTEPFTKEQVTVSKDHYPHYMLKEIFEQPQTIRQAMLNRFNDEYGTAEFENFGFSSQELLSTRHILILACGTSWHAGCIAAAMLEDRARIPTHAEIASEFRYKNPIVSEETLVIAISQSGETADTLAAVREVKAKGAKVLGICNVRHSSLTREAHHCIFLRAGPEISVCSTKAFTSQLTLLSLFTLYMARLRHLSKEEGQHLLAELKNMPHLVEEVLHLAPQIEKLAQKYAHFDHFFYIGRRYMYPISLEGALKLKEISYVNANGYPAGEMKHGPIALISPSFATIALCGNMQTRDKMLSNMMEVKARGGPLLVFTSQLTDEIERIADDLLLLPASTYDEFACIPYASALQLFAYYIAVIRGTDVDRPRNLAKSVTVE